MEIYNRKNKMKDEFEYKNFNYDSAKDAGKKFEEMTIYYLNLYTAFANKSFRKLNDKEFLEFIDKMFLISLSEKEIVALYEEGFNKKYKENRIETNMYICETQGYGKDMELNHILVALDVYVSDDIKLKKRSYNPEEIIKFTDNNDMIIKEIIKCYKIWKTDNFSYMESDKIPMMPKYLDSLPKDLYSILAKRLRLEFDDKMINTNSKLFFEELKQSILNILNYLNNEYGIVHKLRIVENYQERLYNSDDENVSKFTKKYLQPKVNENK